MHTFHRYRLHTLLFAAIALALPTVHAAPVLMISIDGLKPEYVTHADEHGLCIPTLRRFLIEGTYADGVLAVVPTVTYPDHTTLITGVWPAEHGILNNTLFDPLRSFGGAWYWYAGDIHVPTLWDAAREAGISTASVSWPVSVNAPVDTLIPEYWRGAEASVEPDSANLQDTELMAAISRPDGLLLDMEKRLGPYMMGNDTSIDGDRIRTRYSIDILDRRRPGFMTIHLSSLDETEHMTGPFSAESNKNLEAIDGMVGELIDAALKIDPSTVIVIVSDHGFAEIHHALNIAIPFLQAGLVDAKSGPDGKDAIVSWKAEPWASGGLAAIMLHDPADTKIRDRVSALLTRLAADPANGIAQVLDKKDFEPLGGFPNAAFILALKPGFTFAGAFSGPLVTDLPRTRGTHGYLPSFPEMRASFFAMGQGIARGRDLGVIDMRQIAASVALILDAHLPTAKQPPLHLNP